MELFTVIAFIVLGIILIIVEVIFVPGTTIVGIGGFICGGYGIYLSFKYYGMTAGILVTVVSCAIALGALIYSLKSRSWERFSLGKTMTSKFNDEFKLNLKVGDVGETISSLKPIGKAVFDDQETEVSSMGAYVREKSPVKIIKIEENKIFVETINNT
ncbi:MAG: hypothetical protein KI790_03500 [Cyclobacteriaceae bacterium]|nr:hypothetical protein [Cyclobacteriaceae bacterium HetDA_MAG_MS6]